MKHEEMQPIRELMVEYPDPDEDQIRDLAEGLLLQRAEAEVRSAIGRVKLDQGYTAQTAGMQYYPLLSPPENDGNPVVVSDGPDEKVVTLPPRRQWNVRLKDMDAFAKLHGLDVKAMTEVGEGKRQSFRGWSRVAGYGKNWAGEPYAAPKPKVNVAAIKEAQKRTRVVTSFSERPTFFTPNQG